jgi:hypothetical protein
LPTNVAISLTVALGAVAATGSNVAVAALVVAELGAGKVVDVVVGVRTIATVGADVGAGADIGAAVLAPELQAFKRITVSTKNKSRGRKQNFIILVSSRVRHRSKCAAALSPRTLLQTAALSFALTKSCGALLIPSKNC